MPLCHLPKRAWALALLLAWGLFAAQSAFATTTVRIEWMRGGYVYSAETVSSSGTAASSGAAPAMGGTGQARITSLGGAAIVAPPSASPTATQTNGQMLKIGDGALLLNVGAGDHVSIIEASTGPSPLPTADSQADADIVAFRALQLGPGSTTAALSNPVVPPNDCKLQHFITTTGTNANNVKATPGRVCWAIATTSSGVVCTFRWFNLTTTPVPGTSTPNGNLDIPSSTSVAGTPLVGGFAGASFDTGIGFDLTGGSADNDATNCTGVVKINMLVE